MKKMISLLAIFTLTLSMSAFAEMGKLNVITDMDDAEIFIDGSFAGKSFIQNYPVEPGSHYIMVMKDGKKIYAKSVDVYSGQTQTIPTSNFVGIKTSTPNRGAVDVEAARIRETRGNGAFGVFAGTPLASPMAGISFKYWFMNPFGIQLIGSAHSTSDYQETQGGVRLLYNLGTKIFLEQPIDAYWAVGGGHFTYADRSDANKDYEAGVLETAVGLEFGVGNIFFSVEGGIESVSKPSESIISMKASGGIHYYF